MWNALAPMLGPFVMVALVIGGIVLVGFLMWLAFVRVQWIKVGGRQ